MRYIKVFLIEKKTSLTNSIKCVTKKGNAAFVRISFELKWKTKKTQNEIERTWLLSYVSVHNMFDIQSEV